MLEVSQQPHDSTLRSQNCRSAIEPRTLALLGRVHAPFVDFQCLLHAILPTALAAGWHEDEVRAALEVIVADLRVG